MGFHLVEPGAIRKIAEVLERLRPDSVLLLHGESFSQHHAARYVHQALKTTEFEAYLCPKADYLELTAVEEVVEFCRRRKVDLVLAVGGGRILDLAKLVALGIPEKNSVRNHLDGEAFVVEPIRLVAVPTTAGSGSQATHFAVVFNQRRKYSVAHPGILPVARIVDSELLASCPSRLKAVSGLDALCQAVESYWSVKSSSESRGYAEEAILLCRRSLSRSVLSNDAEALADMALAADLAGRAINLSFTTAAHACTYVLTTHYGVDHGHGVAILLARLVVLNGEAAATPERVEDPRGAHFVRERMERLQELFEVNNAFEFGNVLLELIEHCGLKTHLKELKVDLDELLQQALPLINVQRLKNNPITLDWSDIETLYRSSF